MLLTDCFLTGRNVSHTGEKRAIFSMQKHTECCCYWWFGKCWGGPQGRKSLRLRSLEFWGMKLLKWKHCGDQVKVVHPKSGIFIFSWRICALHWASKSLLEATCGSREVTGVNFTSGRRGECAVSRDANQGRLAYSGDTVSERKRGY